MQCAADFALENPIWHDSLLNQMAFDFCNPNVKSKNRLIEKIYRHHVRFKF